MWIIILNFVNDGCIWWISYNFWKQSESHWDLLGFFCLICLLNWFPDIFLHFSLSSWYFELQFIWIFVNCNIFYCNIIIKFYYFLYENFIFTDLISIFVDLVDLWFLATIRQPNYLGCVCVCVFGLFFIHTFFFKGILAYLLLSKSTNKACWRVVVSGSWCH